MAYNLLILKKPPVEPIVICVRYITLYVSLNILNMNWQDILFGDENLSFLAEIALRSVIMFLLLFLGLRVAGKRGVKQLSIFELLIIIALGSAAGDPMIYKEVGVIYALVVFVVIFLIYWMLTKLMEHSETMESILEANHFISFATGRPRKNHSATRSWQSTNFMRRCDPIRFFNWERFGKVFWRQMVKLTCCCFPSKR